MDLLTKEYTDIIEKHLPAQVGNVLQSVLKEGETNKTKIVDLQKRISDLEDLLTKARSEISLYESKQHLYNDLTVKASKLEEDQRKLQLDSLTYQLQAEKDKTNFCKEISLGLVRNVEFRKTVFNSRSEPVTQNGYTTTMNLTDSTNEHNTTT